MPDTLEIPAIPQRKRRSEDQSTLVAGVRTGGTYRVRLPGVKVRSEDAEGRVIYQDYLDVDAFSEADAFADFCRYNGITSTTQTPKIEKLGAQ